MAVSVNAPSTTTAATTTASSVTFATINVVVLMAFIALYNIVVKQFRHTNVERRTPFPLPPGPTPWPVVGCIVDMLLNKPTFRWIHRLMEEMDTEIACIRLGNVHIIPVTDPKIAREFLRKQDAVFASRPTSMAAYAFSSGYLTTTLTPYGEQWKKMRRVLMSDITSPSRHKWLHDKRVEEADNLVKYVFNQSKRFGMVNVRTATRQYCGNLIRKIVFSKRYFRNEMLPTDGGPTIDEEHHVDAIFTSLTYLYAFCVSDYFPMLVGFDLDGHEKIVQETVMTLKRLHEPIISERIKQWRGNNNKHLGESKMEPQDLLDVLITLKAADGKPLLTPQEISAQVREIMMAAMDNPANAVEWAMAEMINQPLLLIKAVEEMDRVVGKEKLVQESDIPQLNYIKACAREAFRLHPIAPFNVPHVAMSDTTLGGHRIPKGSHILLSRVGLGRNPKVWDEPLKFKPERHIIGDSAEVMLAEHDLRFISFSTGRRGCIAVTLGTTMTVMLLARLIQGFSWRKPPNVSSINLDESRDNLFLAEQLIAQAKSRLPLHLYPA